MATPGSTFPFDFVERATIPAAPPNRAISTSYMVGDVLASSSDRASFRGDNKK